MKLRFWGVRGSIACPGPETVQYGGNTPCLQIAFEGTNRIVIVDAGTGIRLLGNKLMENYRPDTPIKADIFITHTHWDHILGFPFFTPIYIKGTELNIYGPVTYEEDNIEKIVGDQLSYRYFPVLHSDLAANLIYHELKEGEFDLGDGIQIQTKFLNHTLLCLGYRFEFKGKTICTAYDTEPYRNLFTADTESPDYDSDLFKEGELAVKEETEQLIAFYNQADILIHDAQYTEAEYLASKIGWGHSPFEYAVDIAQKANVKKIVLFHHDPLRTDAELVELEDLHRAQQPKGSQLEIEFAREGMTLEV